MSEENLLKSFVNESEGKNLKTEIYKSEGEHKIRYFINGDFIKEETYWEKSIQSVEELAKNWLDNVKNLNG